MSTSPELGQLRPLPKIQNAGQLPWRVSICPHISNRRTRSSSFPRSSSRSRCIGRTADFASNRCCRHCSWDS